MDTKTDPILIVEDDRNIASLVEQYLTAAGFSTLRAHDGAEGLRQAREKRPQLVILDLMLPAMDGWEVCRELRKSSNVPILMLTEREDEMDRVVGFSLGADDYVIKPFSPRELVERVKAILRRAGPVRPVESGILVRGPLTLEREKHKVCRDGAAVALTPSEYKLLCRLMTAPGRVYSRSELLNDLYDHEVAVIDRVVDVHIGKLRQKIEDDPSNPALVLTVHGIGYCFSDQVG